MRRLHDVLVDEFGLDLAGWTLTGANDISDGGRVIVGDGINPSGDPEAWMAILPCHLLQSQGDFDVNRRIDLIDFGFFQLCFDNAPAYPDWLDTCLCAFDLDDNGIVDLDDYAALRPSPVPSESP